MIIRDWELLFSKYDLRAVLANQLAELEKRVRGLPADKYDTQSDELLAAAVASELVVSPLVLLEDKITVSSREAQIDISHYPDRHFSQPGPFYVGGLEITYHLPYMGERILWECRPNQFTLNPPRAVIARDELKFPVDSPDRNVAATKKTFDEYVSSIKQWIPWVNQQVGECNQTLETNARQQVSARRKELNKAKTDIEALGFPVKAGADQQQGAPSAAQDRGTRRAAKRASERRKFDVALSFAGEDREYVERVATALRDANIAVFYDGFETVDLWGNDLAAHLGKVYSEDSHFVVMFISRHYIDKAWPGHERQHALSRALKGDAERVLPVRLDDSDVPGLPATTGYLDVRVLTPEKLAELIRQKLDKE